MLDSPCSCFFFPVNILPVQKSAQENQIPLKKQIKQQEQKQKQKTVFGKEKKKNKTESYSGLVPSPGPAHEFLILM